MTLRDYSLTDYYHDEAMQDDAAESLRDELLPAAKAQAHAELLAECSHTGSEAHRAWREFCNECRDVSAKEFIDDAAKIGADLFSERTDEIMSDFIEGMEANV